MATEYITLNEVNARLKAFTAANADVIVRVSNHVAHKTVWRKATEAELAARPYTPHTTIWSWSKLRNDSETVKAQPELRGMWHQNTWELRPVKPEAGA